MSSQCLNKHKGFTLMEVMLALLVISVGLVALVQAAQTGTRITTTVAEKSAAYHVADQVMMQLYQRSDLTIGTHQGQELFSDRNYYWRAELKSTDNESINRIDLVVGKDRALDYFDAQLTGFKLR
ncbi:type II secretion system minor pseudopilin GspI [Marinicella sp. S1101]|uniref:type II secretion system minor pseudopilin GspI n=1 Tax=Marinicella marina TaxID=2996016 RepID=UPI002260F3C0|nr:type II secretion system minor pseudopilin GspI [Marinicella marina]MCX7554769.1 type II secretion system minor pseudopilin GspI [Marinicella marina]MDJ1140998.1 type II secretion system minor pseudopilin GspI [Marinicella marina]